MKQAFLASIAAATLHPCAPALAQDVDFGAGADSRLDAPVAVAKPAFDPQMATVQFMNYMNYVVYTLSSYQNVYVIEEAYKNLSTGNLNLNRIPDETVLDAIEKMLDTIHAMRANEKERDYFVARQDRDRQQKQQEILVGVLKSATGVAMDAVSQNWAAVATGVAGSAVDAYSSWAELQRTIERENAERAFQYDRKKDDELHEQNKYQLRLQYDLTKRYDIDDRFRLSDENAKALVEAVKSSDPNGVFARLRVMARNQKSYDLFPMFWRHYACFALAAKDYPEALRACDRFDEANRNSLFRRDPMAAQVAMARISAMIATDAVDAGAVRRALATIGAYNDNCADVDMAFFCATTFWSVLHDAQAALETLDALVAGLEDNARAELRKYRDLRTEEKADAPWTAPPLTADLFRCNVLRKAIESSAPDGSFPQTLETIIGRSTTSEIEKLFLVGDVRVRDLWEKGRSDVCDIVLRREKRWNGDGFVAFVPVTWFALGDFPVSLDLMRGTNAVATLEENFKARKAASLLSGGSRLFARISWKCPAKSLRGVDSVVLRLPNKSWPVAIRYLPPAGVDVAKAEFAKDETEYIPVSVDFMGKPFEIEDLGEAGRKTLEVAQAAAKPREAGGCAVAVPFPAGTTVLATNEIVSIGIDGRDFRVDWTNATDAAWTLEVSATFLGEFGATVCDLSGDVEMQPGAGGALVLKWPDDLADASAPAIVVLSARKTKSLAQTGKEWGDKATALGGKISGKASALSGKGKALAGKWLKRGDKNAEKDAAEETDDDAGTAAQ